MTTVGGARFRVWCTTSNWCFNAIDSAATALTLPGHASLINVVSR